MVVLRFGPEVNPAIYPAQRVLPVAVLPLVEEFGICEDPGGVGKRAIVSYAGIQLSVGILLARERGRGREPRSLAAG